MSYSYSYSYSYATKELKSKAAEQKNGQKLVYPDDQPSTQKYLLELPSVCARKIFHARSGTIDLKSCRKYKYGENTSCRLCNESTEDVHHVVNVCSKVSRDYMIDIYEENNEHWMEMAKRLLDFDKEIEQLESLCEILE